MKSIKMLIMAAFSILSVSLFAQTAKTETFKVYGNCSACKKNIEKAAFIPGVEKANWNKETKMMTLIYNASKINTDSVQKRIAAAGYDTEKYKGDNNAYNKLDECCQYDRKADGKMDSSMHMKM